MRYLTTTFSPAMLKYGIAEVKEISLDEARDLLRFRWESAVGHEITSNVLSTLVGIHVPFARINLALVPGDDIICIIPNFRANEAREFTKEEIESAGYRSFYISVR